ncbi:MAG: NUDIX domain-containing protein [Clostridia bacterium]|nr:NUDIX domain-containing protein [Clostridia bacterium]
MIGAESEGWAVKNDLTLPADGGLLNVRVGAIIQKDGKVLMVKNPAADYYYSVGGRIAFGETSAEAVVREVEEETGVKMEVDRLGFIHETFFVDKDEGSPRQGTLIYEISFYFFMKTPENFEPVCESTTNAGQKEALVWVSPESDERYYPAFFRTELKVPFAGLKHIVTDERTEE